MAERFRDSTSFYYGGPRRASQSDDQSLGPRKTLLVLVVVAGCFAVLWPKVFYPMLVNSTSGQIKPGPVDKISGCCDVISEIDLDTIKIMSELCGTIIEPHSSKTPSPKEIVTQCRTAVLETCGIDISAVLQERVSLGHSVKQILDEVRTLNGSLCLKYNFGVSPWSLGVPHRVHVNIDPAIRQERPTHIRPEMVHPAFKERGRAIPQPEVTSSRRPGPPPRIVEGRPGPIPGMRPAMGGAGHIVPPSKQSNNGFLGVLMPIYTVGFVVFFTYTIMKLVFKKKTETYSGSSLYPPVDTDDHQFQKEVFESSRDYYNRPNRDNSKIVVNAVSALLEEVNQELESRKQQTVADTVLEQDEVTPNGSLPKEEEKKVEEQGSVTVLGMETTASCEGGKKWSRPDSPVLSHPPAVVPKEPSPSPQIFLEGSLPPQSQLLVADAATEAQKDPEDDAPVVLAGKMTLSVISLDSETGTEDSSNSGKKSETSDEEKQTISGNTSDEFEKINAVDLEEEINNIIEEAEIIALNGEKRSNSNEEVERDVIEEISNGVNIMEDSSPELPVTDIVKDPLDKHEKNLLSEPTCFSSIVNVVADAIIEEKPRDIEELLSNEEIKLIAKYQASDNDEVVNEDKEVPPNQSLVAQFLHEEKIALFNQNPDVDEIFVRRNEPVKIGIQEGIEIIDIDLVDVKDKNAEDIEEVAMNKRTTEEIIDQNQDEFDKAENLEGSNENIVDNSEDRQPVINSQADLLLRGLGVEIEENQDNNACTSAESEAVQTNTQQQTEQTDHEETKDPNIERSVLEDQNVNVLDVIDQIIEGIEYREESDSEELPPQDVERSSSDEPAVGRLNGVENETSENELENEDDFEIEEIIEYVDNTDEEGEEIIEMDINQGERSLQNGDN
ncbi:titin isoform X2 [Sitophilus oryzae]|uniref:Titin isoform X2 n=1 Tax=Sitophilus oryzae TaxID=7048 RepID=A0A6J2X1M3_SITOR|nr:titin isoform X2 [Sitophilus oryzae]